LKHHRQDGFTLIELMIAVAIVAILARLAYPAYMESVRKGKRAEGRAALAELMQQEERYMTQNGTYMQFTTSTSSVPFKRYSGSSGAANAAYNLEAEACSSSTPLTDCIRVKATPTFTDTTVGWIKLSSLGAKSCELTTDAKVCWP
jgi:type IV pilus assembly protein PilE